MDALDTSIRYTSHYIMAENIGVFLTIHSIELKCDGKMHVCIIMYDWINNIGRL